jgi:AhpD family alkylhydroperoxidase
MSKNRKPFDKRVIPSKLFYSHFRASMSSFSRLVKAMRTKRMSKGFMERIMLAVTEVNDCKYCNWFHAKNALKTGMTQEELSQFFSGEKDIIDSTETTALLFAQHYADSDGSYDEETYQNLVDTYGEESAKDILAAIQAIMVGNHNGVAFEALLNRIQFNGSKESSFFRELINVLGPILFFPIIIVHNLYDKATAKPAEI